MKGILLRDKGTNGVACGSIDGICIRVGHNIALDSSLLSCWLL